MKILFTVKENKGMESIIDERFGRAVGFLVYETDNEEIEYYDNLENTNAGHGAGIQAASKVVDINVNTLVTGNGPGGKAKGILADKNIDIKVGFADITVKEAIQKIK